MKFAIVIHKDPHSDYGVTVPDLPGCFTAARTVEEAMDLAAEAILFHLEGLIEDGLVIPKPLPVSVHQANPDYKGGVWAMVAVDVAKLPRKIRRINITMPQRVLEEVDRYAKRNGESRSGVLTRAASRWIGSQATSKKRMKRPGRRRSR